MSEVILRALMQLFALIVDVDEIQQVSEKERSIIRAFLARILSNELIEKYMRVFETYLLEYHQDSLDKGSLKRKKRNALTAVRILGICEKINEELEQRQKVYVVIQLVEYISYGIEIRDTELDFLRTVASAFNLPDEEFEDILNFIAFSLRDIPRKQKVLVVSADKEAEVEGIHHIQKKKLGGHMTFLHIPSVNAHIMRYHGKEDLFLNGQHLQAGITYAFEPGSSIRGSKIDPLFFTDLARVFSVSAQSSRISILAKDVVFHFRNSKNGIQEFNLHEESGKLIGIMGGSGVGKSTLLNVLNGNLKPSRGTILINGYNIYDEKEKPMLDGVIGYIPQDDLLIEDLTVYQNLYYNARLCMDGMPEDQLKNKVDRVLKDLGLWAVRHLKVGKPLNKVISGGQRKRLNIALELIREPSVLFVDEPTSGLSSVDSEVVMNLLREQVYKGKLVFVNIHQPSSNLYKMFDRIIFLDEGGYQIYSGNPSQAIVYFKTRSNHANAKEDQCRCCGNVDPDQVLQIIEAKIVNERGRHTRNRRVSSREWFQLYKTHNSLVVPETLEKSDLPENNFNIPNRLRQMKIFFTRDILSKLTNMQYVLISMLEAPLLAVVLAYFTKYFSGIQSDPYAYVFRNNENLPSFLLMSVIVFLFLGLTISSEEIIKDRTILQRESFLNLSRFSYLNSKVLIMFGISAIQTLTYVLLSSAIFEIRGMVLPYWLVLFATSCFANILGLNISSGLNSVITIYILVPFLLIPQILFSGVLVKFDKLHKSLTNYEYVPLIGDVMTSRWAFEALAVTQYKDNRYERHYFDLDQQISNASYLSSFLIPTLEEKLDAVENRTETSDGQLATDMAFLCAHLEELVGGAGLGLDVARYDFSVPGALDGTDQMRQCLSEASALLREKIHDLNLARNQLQTQLVSQVGGLKAYSNLQDENDNKKLGEIVLNRSSLEKYEERDGRIIRKFEPIYMVPTSPHGRAHLYAPVKMIGHVPIDTLWFNALVIWAFTLLLYATLYVDLLRKVITFGAQITGKGAQLRRKK
ncbi:MAG: ATP-binding cassette domain-containing protein [Bacteroidales bacterium]